MTKKPAKEAHAERRVVARNRRARHDYHVLRSLEAGLVLVGTEVKSLRAGQAVLSQAFARIEGGEVWLVGAEIPPYPGAASSQHAPKQRRKLLLHRHEIGKLEGDLEGKGHTLVPIEIYFNAEGRAKVLLAVAVGRQQHDKRQALAEKDARREMDRVARDRRR